MEFLRMAAEIRTPVLDYFFQICTFFGQETLVVGILCFIYWCRNKTIGYQMAFTYFASGLFIQALKVTFRIERPWVLDPDFKAVESAVPAATGYSFPSGHTQGGTSMFSVFIANTKKIWLKILCALAFLLVGFSRLYLGVHTPKDVLTSMGISLFFAWVVYVFMKKIKDDTSKDLLISIVLAVVALLVLLYSVFLMNQGVLSAEFAKDCFKAAGSGLGFALGFYIERTYIQFSVKTKTVPGQMLKFLVGIGILLLLKEGFKVVFGTSLAAGTFRYFLLIVWIVIIYPIMFEKRCK